MMDAFSLYPRGFHPVRTNRTPDVKSYSRPWPRILVPVKYYYVDFGIAVKIPPGTSPLVLGRDGQDQEVPELSDRIPYDPFKVDIFILGNVFRHNIYAVCSVLILFIGRF